MISSISASSISPDLDTLLYTLSGQANPDLGWGRAGETWTFMKALEALGGETWFRLGDGDLATHVERTRRLKAGESLSAIIDDFRRRLGIGARLLPMSDDPVRTRLRTSEGWLDFQDYFVRLRCSPAISALAFDGAEAARPHPDFLAAVADRGVARGRPLPVEPVHQHRPDPRRARRPRRAARLPGGGHCRVADRRRPGR